MDQIQPDGSLQTRAAVEERIRRIFADHHDIHRVVFSDVNIEKQDLFIQMHDVLKDKVPVKLEYTEAEFLQYFDLKAWKGREMHDLYRNKNKIQGITSGFFEGIRNLEKNRKKYSDDVFQNFIFSAIQQCHKELEENVMEPFVKKHGNSQMEFEDYAAYIELKKLVYSAQTKFRDEAKRLLPINPDDTSNWRNALRRCQHCGEVWLKVSGCDGETTCGLIPEVGGDPRVSESYVKYEWEEIDGNWRPKKVRKYTHLPRQTLRRSSRRRRLIGIKVGCGLQIVWKDQAILSLPEVEALLSTLDLQQVLASFSLNRDFVTKRDKKEKNIVVFSKLGADGKVIDR
jgi:hypothetical protein